VGAEMSLEAIRGLMSAWTQVIDKDVDDLKYALPTTWKYEVTTYTRKRIHYWPSRGGRRWK
jgi:hypothetical protein